MSMRHLREFGWLNEGELKSPVFVEATEDTIYSELEKLGIKGHGKLHPPYVGITEDGSLWEMYMHNKGDKKGWMVHNTRRRVKPEIREKIFGK